MKLPHLKYPEKLEPIKGIIRFFFILLCANVFWKYNVLGEESATVDSMVTFWGLDISAPFVWMAFHVAHVTTGILHLCGWPVTLDSANVIHHANGNAVLIIWACTGIKQAYICFCILAFARGPWVKKLWYIPLSLLVVYLFNIFRISFIAATIEHHPAWFGFMHLYAFKYVFYGIIFLMWVFWEEKMAGHQQAEVKS